MIRLHNGNSLTAVPIYLPEDPAIPAREVPARPGFTREFVGDHEILQREQKGAATGVMVLAYGVVLAIALGLLGLLGWGLHRLAGAVPGAPATPRRPGAAGVQRPRGQAAPAT